MSTGRAAGTRTIIVMLALVAITLVAYAPVRHNDFVSFDDGVYLSNNAHVKAGLSWTTVAWAFTTADANFWHPVTWLSLLADVRLFGVQPLAVHLSSVVLHIVSTLLLFVVLIRTTKALFPSAVVAALFAVHPLHVESVAWAAERKDTVSTLFWMLTMLAYAWYVSAPGWRRYAAVVACFALGLMAKPMLVTLPFVLLLMDVWPLGRVRYDESVRRFRPSGRDTAKALLVEKVPLFVLAIAASIVAYVTQGAAVATFDAIPLGERLANGLLSYAVYMWKMIWPAGLSVFYPYAKTVPLWPAVGSVLLLSVVSFLVVRELPRRPYLAVGWFWYLGTLVPVVGVIQVGSHAMADRYTYVPLVGLFIMVAWGARDLLRARDLVVASVAVVLTSSCVLATRAQVAVWRDSVTLWRHALLVTPDNAIAHCGLGRVLDGQGRYEEAFAHLRESVRLAPGFAEARNSLGRSLLRQGRLDEAITQYEEAVALAPANRDMRADLALALEQRGRFDDAAGQYRQLLAGDPGDAEIHDRFGHVLANQRRVEEAVAEFREALRLRPDYAPAHDNLGTALAGQGRTDEAIERFREALRLDPGYTVARENLGRALASQGRRAEAIAAYEAAVAAMPNSVDLHNALGFVLAGEGRTQEAIAHFSEALRLQPASEQAHLYLGLVLAATGKGEEGAAHLNEALRLNPTDDTARRALETIRQTTAVARTRK